MPDSSRGDADFGMERRRYRDDRSGNASGELGVVGESLAAELGGDRLGARWVVIGYGDQISPGQ